MSPFLMLICDPATPRATLAPTAGRLRGVTTFAATFFPCLQLEIDRDGPLVALDVTRDRRLISVGFDANQMREITRASGESRNWPSVAGKLSSLSQFICVSAGPDARDDSKRLDRLSWSPRR